MPLPLKAETCAKLAAELGFDNLYDRGRDSLDFREVSIASLRDALQAAYEAGWRAGQERMRDLDEWLGPRQHEG